MSNCPFGGDTTWSLHQGFEVPQFNETAPQFQEHAFWADQARR